MEKEIILTTMPLTDLVEEVARAIRTELQSIPQSSEPEDLLTRVQTAKLLGVTLPTLREYTRRGLIVGYRIGSRVRYKRSEVIDSLERIQTLKQK